MGRQAGLTFYIFTISVFIVFTGNLTAEEASITVKVTDVFDDPVPDTRWALIQNGDTLQQGIAEWGVISASIPSNRQLSLYIDQRVMAPRIISIPVLQAGESYNLTVSLEREMELTDFFITEERERPPIRMERIDPEALDRMTAPGQHFESILQTLPGVSMPNELSSQYQVRGGSFDENLVYLNDFEIFRPFLQRSGQQEGLSIINPDMIESIEFSAGGFDATYGNKMSSALSINYKEPYEFESAFSASMLGGTAYTGGIAMNDNLSYSIGARYRSNQYLLGALETEGNYKPQYFDFQSYLTYYINDEWDVSLLSYYGRNNYQFFPETRETQFGTVEEAFRLTIFFDGMEQMQYHNLLNGLTFTYEPSPFTTLEFKASHFASVENEDFNVIGQYWLDQLDTDLGSDDYGDVDINLGVGAFHDFARNRIEAHVYNTEHRGHYENRSQNLDLKWGVSTQGEYVNDRLKEWERLDSAGFSVPRISHDHPLELKESINTTIDLHTIRHNAFLQNTFSFSDSFRTEITTGIRSQFWHYNNELTVSPRLQFSFEPNYRYNWRKRAQGVHDSLLRNDMIVSLSAGIYHQPPFYRELRDLTGTLYEDIRSQRSIHLIAGNDYFFKLFERPFKWSTEVYYKYMDNLIPYQFDNMRLRYYSRNNAEGYATGIDMKLYGEFIHGLPSWVSASLMQTRERVTREHNVPGGIELPDDERPRPTDQRFLFSFFFQDFLPSNPNYKVNLNLVYGTGMPHGPPDFAQSRNLFRMPGYQRVDIGFSTIFAENGETLFNWDFLGHFKRLEATAEVFNAFGISNTINYMWIQDLHGRRFAIPNHLTARRINLRINARF